MPRVKIDTPGVSVELESTKATVIALGKQAMDIFREANSLNERQRPGPGFGLTVERGPA